MEFPKNLHHAYVIEGDVQASQIALLSYLQKEFDIKPGSVDLFLFSSPSFGVEDSKEVKEANLRKAISGKKFIVASFSSISIQAQNSLLKTLEEPYPGTHIFLLTQTSSVFLPTVLSRVHILSQSGEPEVVSKKAHDFLKASPSERMEMIKALMAEKESEKIQEADIEKFVAELESLTHKKIKDMKPFIVVDEYLRDTSSSSKMLLEYLALTLPEL